MTDNSLFDLCPDLKAIVPQFIEKCASAGITVKVLVTWRNSADQNACKAAGLSNASGGQSPHNLCNSDGSPSSRAIDFGVFDMGTYITDGTDQRYAQAGAIGKGLGLAWGGDWHHPDYDHLEMLNWHSAI